MLTVKLAIFISLFVSYQCTVNINIVKSNANIPPADDAACMARYIVHNSGTYRQCFNTYYRLPDSECIYEWPSQGVGGLGSKSIHIFSLFLNSHYAVKSYHSNSRMLCV